MDSLPEILATAYGTLMVGSAIIAVTLGGIKRKRDLKTKKVFSSD